MCLETHESDMVRTVKGNIPVIPIRWFLDGRAFCRIETRDFHGSIGVNWKAYQASEIQGAPESLVKILGDCPINLENPDGVCELRVF